MRNQDISKAREAFRSASLGKWSKRLETIFPVALPNTASWQGVEEILSVLESVASGPTGANHVFMPTGGGMDLTGAELAAEDGCIALLTDGSPDILKPSRLDFENPVADPQWAYFRIEASHLPPTRIDEELGEVTSIREALTELRPGEYHDVGLWDVGNLGMDEEGREIPFPKEARRISRYLSGSFVIFSKGSFFNSVAGDLDAYLGLHNNMDRNEFRAHVVTMAEMSTRTSGVSVAD